MTLGRFNFNKLGVGGAVVTLAAVLQSAGVFGLTVRSVITTVAVALSIMLGVNQKGK